MAEIMRSRNGVSVGAATALRPEGIEQPTLPFGIPPAGGIRQAGTGRVGQPIDREQLVPPRPGQAAEHLARGDLDGVDGTDAAIDVEAGRILAEARDDPRPSHGGDAIMEAQASCPAGQPSHGQEAAVDDRPHFAVSAVVDPELPTVQSGRMRAGQATRDNLTILSREDHPATVDRKVLVIWPPRW